MEPRLNRILDWVPREDERIVRRRIEDKRTDYTKVNDIFNRFWVESFSLIDGEIKYK